MNYSTKAQALGATVVPRKPNRWFTCLGSAGGGSRCSSQRGINRPRAAATVRPNPSFRPTRYGRHRKPGLRHLVHHLSPGLRCLPRKGDSAVNDAASTAIYVNKLAAVKRLLCAAFRMHCSTIDPLAVHVVGSSAYNILCELRKQRGQDEAAAIAEIEELGILAMAQKLVAGTLEREVAEDTYLSEFLREVAYHLDIQPDTDLNALVGEVSVDRAYSKSFHGARTRAYNFLKHGNDEAEPALQESDVDNLGLLIRATMSFESVSHDDLGLEGVLLKALYLSTLAQAPRPGHRLGGLITKLQSMNESERLQFCTFHLEQPQPALP